MCVVDEVVVFLSFLRGSEVYFPDVDSFRKVVNAVKPDTCTSKLVKQQQTQLNTIFLMSLLMSGTLLAPSVSAFRNL